MRKRRLFTSIVLMALACVAVGCFVMPFMPAYRDARFGKMSPEELSRIQLAHLNDPVFLYYFGRRLNEQHLSIKALPVLEHAAGLDPDSARIRDEWTKAQLACGEVSLAYGQLHQFAAAHPRSAEAQLLLGKYYITEQQFEQAGKALEDSVGKDAGSAEAWSLLAHARIKLGNNGGAQVALEHALRLNPSAALDHLQLASLLASTDAVRAKAEFLRAVSLAPGDAVCHRQYGRFLYDAGDSSAAEQELRRAVELDPTDPFAAYHLANCLLALNRPNEALPLLTAAAEAKPFDPVPADALRRLYRKTGDQQNEALWSRRFVLLSQQESERRRLQDITIAHPEDREARKQFAAALARIQDVNGCVKQYALALKQRPDSPLPLLTAARSLDQAGFSAEALPLARQAAAGGRSNADVYETLGDILVHLGRLYEGAVNYERIRDWRADRRELYKQRIAQAADRINHSDAPAERLLRQSRNESAPDRAEDLLRQALQYEPENTRCLRELLNLQFSRGRGDAALVTARRLSGLAPEDGTANSLLVILTLQSLGNTPLPEETGRALDRALRAAADDPSVVPTFLYARALLALKRGQAAGAVPDLEQAIRLDPSSPAAYRKLADARTLLGDKIGAQKALAQFEQRQKERNAALSRSE